MQTPSPFWSAQVPPEQFAAWLAPRLSRMGLRALQTFDLHDARMAAGECQCPHHGTSACDCQMVVLLVYAASSPPVTMVIHGSEGTTWVSLVDRPGQRADGATMLAIKRALEWDAALPA